MHMQHVIVHYESMRCGALTMLLMISGLVYACLTGCVHSVWCHNTPNCSKDRLLRHIASVSYRDKQTVLKRRQRSQVLKLVQTKSWCCLQAGGGPGAGRGAVDQEQQRGRGYAGRRPSGHPGWFCGNRRGRPSAGNVQTPRDHQVIQSAMSRPVCMCMIHTSAKPGICNT